MWFMENAHPAYDHSGARLLFFNPTLDWQYEYRFQTQTWHKILSGVTGATILNSYPDCLLSYTDGSTPKVMNFSTVLNYEHIVSDTNNPVLGIIATRPFDLGEPDVRKSINSIRIRGRYNRCDPVSSIPDVQYILLGSMDGLNWQRLTSLRGGSYKVFRMVIVTRLSPMERITWIDIDYETRMTNKLR